MIKFKNCPRCRGDLYLSQDIHGKFYSCLQCGYLRDVFEVNEPRIRTRKEAVVLQNTAEFADAERDAA